jgi:fimbrial chaperone protein
MLFPMSLRRAAACRLFAAALASFPVAALPASFSVSPIRADLKPGVLSETITVTNDSPARLRVAVKLVAWTQDATGKDVYTDSSDLVYFPRQLELEPGAKRLIRIGTKAPATGTERAYRLFIEEVPSATPGAPTAVSFYFRFGVPVFVTPGTASPQPEIGQPVLAAGKLSLVVRNPGTQHFRASRVSFSDNVGWTRDVGGWYSLPGTSRTYQVEVPLEVCQKAKGFSVTVEGEDSSKFERTLAADPARCA